MVHHASSTSVEHRALNIVLLPLDLHLLLDVATERHRTLGVVALLGMKTAQGKKLFAVSTATLQFPLALFSVSQHLLHTDAGTKTAVGVATLATVNQRLHESLENGHSSISRVCIRSTVFRGHSVVQIEAQFVHFVWMAILLVASDTEVIVLQADKVMKRTVAYFQREYTWGHLRRKRCSDSEFPREPCKSYRCK